MAPVQLTWSNIRALPCPTQGSFQADHISSWLTLYAFDLLCCCQMQFRFEFRTWSERRSWPDLRLDVVCGQLQFHRKHLPGWRWLRRVCGQPDVIIHCGKQHICKEWRYVIGHGSADASERFIGLAKPVQSRLRLPAPSQKCLVPAASANGAVSAISTPTALLQNNTFEGNEGTYVGSLHVFQATSPVACLALSSVRVFAVQCLRLLVVEEALPQGQQFTSTALAVSCAALFRASSAKTQSLEPMRMAVPYTQIHLAT